MTSRRDFLRKSTIALAGGLVLGDAAMEMYERLTHRKVWALGAVPVPLTESDINRILQAVYSSQFREMEFIYVTPASRIRWSTFA